MNDLQRIVAAKVGNPTPSAKAEVKVENKAEKQILDLPKIIGKKALVFLLSGEQGTGKTTLSGRFPKPVILPIEDGTQVLSGSDVRSFKKPKSIEEIRNMCGMLMSQEHDYKTLIVDSVSALIAMAETEIVDRDRAKSINQAMGGYGAGMSALALQMDKFAGFCVQLREKRDMNIVWIGHSVLEHVTPPDAEAYQRFAIAGGPKPTAPFLRHSDVSAMIRVKVRLMADGDRDRKIALGKDEREIHCQSSPAMVTKNRLGIVKPLAFRLDGENPFAEWL